MTTVPDSVPVTVRHMAAVIAVKGALVDYAAAYAACTSDGLTVNCRAGTHQGCRGVTYEDAPNPADRRAVPCACKCHAVYVSGAVRGAA